MSELEDLIARLRDAADEALADHEDDVARIADMDGPIAAKVCADEPVEVVLALTTVQRCIEALSRAEPGWQPISSAPRDGWVLVPRGPTPEMIKAIEFAIYRYSDCGARDAERGAPYAYAAMLSASPPTPTHAELSPGNSSDLRGEEG